MTKRTSFIFQLIFPHFSGILAGQKTQRPISLPPVIVSASSSIVFFDDTSRRSSATALLVKLGLFSLLCRSKSVTTCHSILCPQQMVLWTSRYSELAHYKQRGMTANVLNRVRSENFQKRHLRTTAGLWMDVKYECEAG